MGRKGSWQVMAEDYESEEEFRGAVRAELADLEAMMFRLGDGFVIASIRVPAGNDYYTAGVAFAKEFMPAAKRSEPEEPPLPAAEPLTVEELAEHFPETAEV